MTSQGLTVKVNTEPSLWYHYWKLQEVVKVIRGAFLLRSDLLTLNECQFSLMTSSRVELVAKVVSWEMKRLVYAACPPCPPVGCTQTPSPLCLNLFFCLCHVPVNLQLTACHGNYSLTLNLCQSSFNKNHIKTLTLSSKSFIHLSCYCICSTS